MKIMLSLLLIGLIIVSSYLHMYHVWKMNDYKTLRIQVALIGLAIIAGILLIYDYRDHSIAGMLNRLSPLE